MYFLQTAWQRCQDLHKQNLIKSPYRPSVSADQLKSQWEQQDVISARVAGAYTRYNAPGDHPRSYITKNNTVDLGTDEAFYEMQAMLFDYADADVIMDFIAQVREFSLEYQVHFFLWMLCMYPVCDECMTTAHAGPRGAGGAHTAGHAPRRARDHPPCSRRPAQQAPHAVREGAGPVRGRAARAGQGVCLPAGARGVVLVVLWRAPGSLAPWLLARGAVAGKNKVHFYLFSKHTCMTSSVS